jgi:hypothetical protein
VALEFYESIIKSFSNDLQTIWAYCYVVIAAIKVWSEWVPFLFWARRGN